MNSHIAAAVGAERRCDIQEDVQRGKACEQPERGPTLRERLSARWPTKR
jgi:hypothetical protein